MLKVTIYFDEEKKEKIIYENVYDIYSRPEPDILSKAYITMRQKDINKRNYFTLIYRKPYSVHVEPQPIKIMEL